MVAVKGMHELKKEQTICECGMSVKGISKDHLKANLKLHKKSKMHKQLMMNKSKEEVKKK